MEKTVISTGQLFALIMLFEFGTALVVPVGLAGGQGVWLSILLALLGGIALFLVNEYLMRQYPGMPLSGYMRKIVGPYIGWTLGLIYIPFFLYTEARDLRDTSELLVISVYDQTPFIAISALMIIAVVYVLYKGLEVLARIGEIYLIVLVVFGIISITLILFSGIIDIKNLLPWIGKGWGPIVRSAYPNIVMFPFAEMICFTTTFLI